LKTPLKIAKHLKDYINQNNGLKLIENYGHHNQKQITIAIFSCSYLYYQFIKNTKTQAYFIILRYGL